MAKRGAFIVLEGLDRSGKSTQCAKLVENLVARGVRTKGIRFPGKSGWWVQLNARYRRLALQTARLRPDE